MVLNLNLSPGDKITIYWGNGKKKKYQPLTVVREYTHHILVQLDKYRTCINKTDLICKRLQWMKGWRRGTKGAIKAGFNYHLYPTQKTIKEKILYE